MICTIDGCYKRAEKRNLFIDDKPLCDNDYIGYLELIINGLEFEITDEDEESYFERYKYKLELMKASSKSKSSTIGRKL